MAAVHPPQHGAHEPLARLPDLPIELLECLLSFIPHPADLLALARTSRALHALIAPLTLPWHSIAVPSQNRCVVARLLASPRTALTVRRLIVTDTWTTRGPGYRLCCACKSSSGEPVEVDYAAWEACGARLTGLEELVLHVRDVGMWKGFLRAVRRASNALRSVALQQYLGFMYRLRANARGAIEALDEVRDVQALDWYSALGQGAELFHALTRTLRANAPNLRSIKLNISSEDTASTSFWSLHFPCLHSCKILNVHGSRHVGRFLAQHPTLEVFHFHTASGLKFDLPSDALPRARDVDLRYYGFPELYITLLQPLPSGARRPLHSLGVCAQALGRKYGQEEALGVFCAQLREVSTLRTLTWIDLSHSLSETRSLAPVVRACPRIEEVVFAWNLPTGAALTALCDALAPLPRLHTIRSPASSVVPYELVCQAEVLGRGCRRLRRLNDCVRLLRGGQEDVEGECEGESWRVVKDGRAFWERVVL
ncbi:hypothetical protein CALCODRAFT_485785 [Calocera cornea HHB12733]|uniref:F-box domain-containing protein n=1 Tax=Calocera cornea HHB12733 TaxID=1353952 RepID=A0A165E6A0_9BASI|nr:hypothetical protein CALCODRAFT_485785 [Calocera cornea HHB12733]